tara:strand:- start:14 stop:280 length:267 start_codon:yes stop_codon:yes gene_type:complete
MRKYTSVGATAKYRKVLAKKQKGKCWMCGALLRRGPTKAMKRVPVTESLFPPGFFKHGVHLHHNHKTGEAVGVVHAVCNAVLWQYFGE